MSLPALRAGTALIVSLAFVAVHDADTMRKDRPKQTAPAATKGSLQPPPDAVWGHGAAPTTEAYVAPAHRANLL
jgi:hypothetical protein